jgi:hypothetical protein
MLLLLLMLKMKKKRKKNWKQGLNQWLLSQQQWGLARRWRVEWRRGQKDAAHAHMHTRHQDEDGVRQQRRRLLLWCSASAVVRDRVDTPQLRRVLMLMLLLLLMLKAMTSLSLLLLSSCALVLRTRRKGHQSASFETVS